MPPEWYEVPVFYFSNPAGVIGHEEPVWAPRDSRALDYELELACVIGKSGRDLPDDDRALEHVAGFTILNDWSARDLQAFESQPLGPFLGKSFATSISPWVTPMAALAPFRAAPFTAQEPSPEPYLREEPWALDIALEIELNGSRVAATNARHLYWSVAQQIAHLTVNGAAIRTGDLLGSGTISGAERGERGSLLELSWNGTEPVALVDGSERTFLEDGDEAVLRGVAGEGDAAVALAEVRGRIVAA
jgi:fumarylacetoacetase